MLKKVVWDEEGRALALAVIQVSRVSYSTNATLDMGLTTDYQNVRDAIDGMSASGLQFCT